MTDALLDLDRDAIAALCRQHAVRRLQVFGSVVTGGFDPATSDVDFLVEFADAPTGRFEAYFGLKEGLEALVGRPVDLLTAGALQNPFFARAVATTARELYAA